LKKYFVRLLEKFRSFSYTSHILEVLDAEVRAEVAKHIDNPLLEEILNNLIAGKTQIKHQISENLSFLL
jgi:DNA-binding NarL/FixJ family response regulator